MLCKHCCFACTSKGHDMTQDTFTKALQMAVDNESPITLGGGEPTLHPLFKDFLFQAIWAMSSITVSNGFPAVHMVTNGSNTEIALKLADLAYKGVIGCNLSQDAYHDPIDEKVVRAFTPPKGSDYRSRLENNDCRGINAGNGFIQKQGRAKSWGNRSQSDGCCGGVAVHPTGKVYPCTCFKQCLGTIDDCPGLVPEHFGGGYCCGSKGYKEEVVPMMQSHLEWRAARMSVKKNLTNAEPV